MHVVSVVLEHARPIYVQHRQYKFAITSYRIWVHLFDFNKIFEIAIVPLILAFCVIPFRWIKTFLDGK